MADLVMGAMGNLIPKLHELLKEEYSLQTGVKESISSLTQELELVQAALRKVAQVPWDQLDEHVQLWARQVREASYDMEDVLDTFLVRVQGPKSVEQEERFLRKMTNLFKISKERRKISGDVKDIMSRLQEVAERFHRYKLDDVVARPATASVIDPRLAAMYTQVNKLVGMDKSSSELMSKLQLDDVSNTKTKIVSIVGVGGLGKTTLAKAVYDNLKGHFHCTAFVSVGRNPDLQKVLQMILISLDKQKYNKFNFTMLQDITGFIDELREFLQDNQRYFIVIDDIWEIESWETLKLAIDDDKICGGRVIITTRNLKVATEADDVYKLQPLPYDSSRELLYARIYGHEGRYVHNQPDETSDKFIRKCGGIPLAIITMASLLVGKPREHWSELYKTIDFSSKDNKKAENTMRILSFSYYDMPSHLRTCLLYLSAFQEDSVINKHSLVWKWVAEGFVHKKEGTRLYEIGVGYFNDLINRSMIQAVELEHNTSIIFGCRVHDMVLDFIRSISRDEIFFTVLDTNDQGTSLQQSNVRRLAKHNRTIGGHNHPTNHFEMPKLRSFIALDCVIETWAPLSSFKLLRVLAIENQKLAHGGPICIKDLGHLLHLRLLSLQGSYIDRIPKEIEALRFLQNLDLMETQISELVSSNSLPKQLACLRITVRIDVLDKMFSVKGMTSLEELSIDVGRDKTSRFVKDLGCLRELRALNAGICLDEEAQRDLVESLRHLHELQALRIFYDNPSMWQAAELELPCHLQYLVVDGIKFCKLPSCIKPLCLPNLSRLDLILEHVDEQELKLLGGMPELCYLDLQLGSSASVRNISHSDAVYFPKLRCCKLWRSIVLFVSNKEDNSVSFHMWNGEDSIAMPCVSDDELLQRPRPSNPDDDELKKSEEDELQSPKLSVSDNELHRQPLQKLQHGRLAALAYYLLAWFVHVLAFLKRWSLEKFISNRGTAPGNKNGEDLAAMPSASVSDDQTKGPAAAAAPPFMPSLQVLHFRVGGKAIVHHPNCLDHLGWEHLSSLREINAHLSWWGNRDSKEIMAAVLRREAQVHPNRPTLRIL